MKGGLAGFDLEWGLCGCMFLFLLAGLYGWIAALGWADLSWIFARVVLGWYLAQK